MTGAAVRTSVVVAIGVLACCVPCSAGAQTVGASLQGIVTDSSGGTVPNAEVIVISTATGGVWELKTDSTGHYRVPVLPPGAYAARTPRGPAGARIVSQACGRCRPPCGWRPWRTTQGSTRR